MNLQEIHDAVKLYSDRSDVNDITVYLRIVESRINRKLQTRNQCKRAHIVTTKGKEFYALPADFAGMRDICIRPSIDSVDRTSLEYVAPVAMNSMIAQGTGSTSYTIIGNDVRLGADYDGRILEVIYYQRVLPLSETAPSNWVSESYPEAYIQGLMVEVCSYAKDPEAATMWEGRFVSTLDEMEFEDAVDRWSGPTLATKVI